MVKYLKNFTGKAFREFYGSEAEPKADEPADAGASTDASWTEFSAQVSDVVPVGTAEEVLDWVGEDEDRAKKALEAEQSRSRPRKTVIAALEEVINGSN